MAEPLRSFARRHGGLRPRAHRRRPPLRRAHRPRGRHHVRAGGRAPRRPRLERSRQDDSVQHHHRRLLAVERHHPLLRRGHHPLPDLRAHPAGPAAHLPDLAALRRPQRHRFDLPRLPRRVAPAVSRSSGRAPTTPRSNRRPASCRAVTPRRASRDRWSPNSATASSASSRSRSPSPGRRASSSSTSRRPASRRTSAATWSTSSTSLPAHIGYIIIEHDLDVALRVSRARDDDAQWPHPEGGNARGDRERSRGPGDLSRGRPWLTATAARRSSRSATSRSSTASRTPSRASTSRSTGRILSIVGRNGMGKTTLCNAIVGLKRARSGSISLAGTRDRRPRAPRHRPPRHRLRAAGPPGLAQPDRRRAPPSRQPRRHDGVWTVERVYETFPRLAERADQSRLAALRRRAADARHRPGASRQSAPPRHGRADRGPGARSSSTSSSRR